MTSQSLFASTFIDQNSLEYYQLANDQITIPSSHINSLSPIGKLLIRYIHNRIIENNYDGIIFNPVLSNVRSGVWIADTNSKYYDGGVRICLNTFNNIAVCVDKNVICVIISEEWCYTSDEKLYKFAKA